MSALTAAANGRRRAEADMTDQVTVTRLGEAVTNRATGAITNDPTEVYSGKGRIRPETQAEGDNVNTDGARDLLDQFVVAIPFLAGSGVDVNDEVLVTKSVDPSLVGRTLRVIGVVRGTNVTARRLRCRIDPAGG